MKEMGVSVEQPFFVFEEKEICVMYDPPHLLKRTMALFREHNLFLPVDVSGKIEIMQAKFSDVVEAYQVDQQTPLIFRAMHKIKDVHLQPKLQHTMKVSLAAQVMSRTVAAFLYSLLSTGTIDQRVLATATFIQQVNQLFDSFNGSRLTPVQGKELKCCITENSTHMQYWREAYKMMKSWNFRRLTKTGKVRQVGWLVSLKAIQKIWEYLQSKNISSLRPRSL
ncbi:unnamed protein product, partial [Tenebrio molitor]